MQFTNEQFRVINAEHQHTKIIAVAGAGKTTTLVQLIVKRLQDGIDPRRMLVLMYNKSAQLDFDNKLRHHVLNQPTPQVRTFHSLGLKILQQLHRLGFAPAKNWRPIPRYIEEQIALRCLLETLNSDAEQRELRADPSEAIELFLGFVELFKSDFLSACDTFEALDLNSKYHYFISALDTFEQYLDREGILSFCDMLYLPVRILQSNPTMQAHFANHMDVILVDEYQDINAIQHQLLSLLSGARAKVVAIGDPDQTIYEFRGSKPEFILQAFDDRFQPTQSLPLSQTFRYGYPLAFHANNLIAHNRQRIEQVCIPSDAERLTTLDIIRTDNDAVEIKHFIYQQLSKGESLEDTAILCRLWSNAAEIELMLLRNAIPFTLKGGVSVLERKDLNLLKGLLEIASKGQHRVIIEDRLFWRRLMMTPHLKIKQYIIDELSKKLAVTTSQFKHAVISELSSLNGWEKKQLSEFAESLHELEFRELPAFQALNRYINHRDVFHGITSNGGSSSNAEETIQIYQAFIAYLRIHKMSPADALNHLQELALVNSNDNQSAGINITTIHRSKGLEWQRIIIPSFNAQHFPYVRDQGKLVPSEEESERRLLYVGMTRAIKSVALLAPKPGSKNKLSKFEEELAFKESNRWLAALAGEACTMNVNKAQSTAIKKMIAVHQLHNLEVKEKTRKAIKEGDTLTHSIFGKGLIVSKDHHYLTVDFSGQTRTFSLAHSKNQFMEEMPD